MCQCSDLYLNNNCNICHWCVCVVCYINAYKMVQVIIDHIVWSTSTQGVHAHTARSMQFKMLYPCYATQNFEARNKEYGRQYIKSQCGFPNKNHFCLGIYQITIYGLLQLLLFNK